MITAICLLGGCVGPTIEKINTWLERETPFICSAVKSSRKVLKLVRALTSFVNIDATL